MTSICRACSNGGNSEVFPIDLTPFPDNPDGLTAHLYQDIKNDCPGSTESAIWEVGIDGQTVIQRTNGQQTLYCSRFDIDNDLFNDFDDGVTFTGQIRVEEWPLGEEEDNDFFGFALGFNPGDKGPFDANDVDFILIDWKAGDQRYSNSCRDDQCNRYFPYDPNEPPLDEDGVNKPNDNCFPVQCQRRLNQGTLPVEWIQATEGLAASQIQGLAHADLFWSHVQCPAQDDGSGDDAGEYLSGFIRA